MPVRSRASSVEYVLAVAPHIRQAISAPTEATVTMDQSN